MKIFETNFVTGSLKDTVSGELLTNAGSEFVRSQNGTVMRFDGSNSISMDSLNGKAFPQEGYCSMSFRSRGSLDNTNPFCNNPWMSSNINAFRLEESNVNRYITFFTGDSSGSVNGVESNTPLSNETYYNVVCAWKSSELRIYINGILDVSKVASIPLPSVFDGLNIGKGLYPNKERDFKGDAVYFSIQDTFPTEADIAKEYKDFLARKPLSTQKTNFYYPKPTHLDEDGLVAAYNMIPSPGNVLTDISGKGANGTINGPLRTLDGMSFKEDSNNVAVSVSGEYRTIMFVFSRYNETSATTPRGMLFQEATTNRPFLVTGSFTSSASEETISIGTDAVEYTYTKGTIPANSRTVLFLRWNGSSYDFFVNGRQRETFVRASIGIHQGLVSDLDMSIGGNPNVSQSTLLGETEFSKYYSRSLSDDEIIRQSNNRASQTYMREDFRYLKADGTNVLPIGRTPGTGLYKGVENAGIDGDSKALEATTSGTIVKQSSQAYGTWEFEVYNSGLNVLVHFLSDASSIGAENSYELQLQTAGRVVLQRNDAGVGTNLMYSAPSYFDFNTQYGIKITRSTDGEFTIYIKGGSFGDDYVLVDATGGFGTNPVTDNTYTESKFMVADLDAGDQISNIKLTKGVLQ